MKHINSRHIIQIVAFGLIISVGIGIRLFDLTDPPLDFHAVRQLRSALIARAMYYEIIPDVEQQTKAQASELALLEVYEPPILEALVGLTYAIIGSEHVWVARIFNAFFWAVGGIFLYLMGRRLASFWACCLGLAFYFFLPFSIIASRAFQPDPWMVMWVLVAGYSVLRWSETTSWKWAIIAGLMGGVALLVKIMAGFFIAGIFVTVVLFTSGIKHFWKNNHIWIIAVLTLSPALLYYFVINNQRSGDFFSFWSISLGGLVLTTNFYADWLAMVKGLMGLTILIFACIGLVLAAKKVQPILIGGWVGYGMYGLFFPYQYITHEYYHLPLVALVGLSIIPVAAALISKVKSAHWIWRVLTIGVIGFALFYSVYVARSILLSADYRNEPKGWELVGEALPVNKPFIGLTGDYGMRLRYYGWRIPSTLWPSSSDWNLFSMAGSENEDFDSYFNEVTSGKDYFLVTAFSELESQPLLKARLDEFPVFSEGNGFVIYDLTPKD